LNLKIFHFLICVIKSFYLIILYIIFKSLLVKDFQKELILNFNLPKKNFKRNNFNNFLMKKIKNKNDTYFLTQFLIIFQMKLSTLTQISILI
jgi:hypothetical protein